MRPQVAGCVLSSMSHGRQTIAARCDMMNGEDADCFAHPAGQRAAPRLTSADKLEQAPAELANWARVYQFRAQK